MRTLFLVVSLAACAAAWAQPKDFAALDRNADGFLTRIEAAGNPDIVKRFAQFDFDKDRRLSPSEFIAAREDNERRAERDAALAARVKEVLFAASGLPSKSISVESYDGEVRLSGFVPLADMASRAGRLAAAISGVRSVHNNITVK
jgi:hypothetical protein